MDEQAPPKPPDELTAASSEGLTRIKHRVLRGRHFLHRNGSDLFPHLERPRCMFAEIS